MSPSAEVGKVVHDSASHNATTCSSNAAAARVLGCKKLTGGIGQQPPLPISPTEVAPWASMPDRARWRGSLLGAVVGDCLGAPFEGTTGATPR
jgi:hypothetical protein